MSSLGASSGHPLTPEDLAAIGPSFARTFWTKVDRTSPDTCWPWLGAKKGKYGSVSVQGKMVLAHRVALALSGHALPHRSVAMHSCDNPICVNPSHLRVATCTENRRDCVSKGRANAASGDRNISRKHPEKFQGSRNGRALLTEADVIAIRALAKGGMHQRDIATRYGVGKTTVGMAIRGETWKHAEEQGHSLRDARAGQLAMFPAVGSR